MDADFVLFLALTAFAIAIAGATAFVIFWPLALVHVRDRHPQITARLGKAPSSSRRRCGGCCAATITRRATAT